MCQSDSLEATRRWPKSYRLTAIIESRSALEFKSGTLQKTELIVRPELEMSLSKNLRLVSVGRLYSELSDKLEPGKPEQTEVSNVSRRALIGDRTEMELREFYLDWKIKKHYLTIGKQQIVWGKADGLKILDVVNPINMREFLLDDFDNSRIPLWSIKADLNLNIVKTQLVWIPDLTYHDLPNQNYPFFPAAFFSVPQGNIQIRQQPLKKPDRLIQDSDVGMRVSTFLGGWDITVNYLYKYDDFPVARTQMIDDPSGQILNVAPAYQRYHLAGSTFSTAKGSFTYRGEVGYYFNREFMTMESSASGGTFKSDQLSGVAGLDYTGISNTMLSAQIFADRITGSFTTIGRQNTETNLTFLVSRNFLNETVTTDFIIVQNLNQGDGFIRPKVKWLAKSNLSIELGGDIIYGSQTRLFGQFRERSRLTLQVQWGI
jgi:hypothetical protein